jgi:hypothetical protein
LFRTIAPTPLRPSAPVPPGVAGNWVCFTSFAHRGSGPAQAGPNWVCFAQSARAGRRQGTAGGASQRNSVSNPQSQIGNRRIGFVSHDRTHAPRLPDPVPPALPGVGFVSHILPSAAPAARAHSRALGRNWVCFAQFAPQGLSHPRPSPGARPKLALFRTMSPLDVPSPRFPILLKFGFVLRNWPSGSRSGCSELGSFCTFCSPGSRPRGGIGFVSRNRPSSAEAPSHPAPPGLASFRTNLHHRGTETEPSHLLRRTRDFLRDLGVSVVNSLRLAGEQRAASHWSWQTRRVPDPADRRGCLRGRPYLLYRRLSMPVCCAKTKNPTEILFPDRLSPEDREKAGDCRP